MEAPFGIIGDTKRTILLIIVQGSSTVEELAQKMNLHVSVVRRHLDDMARDGLVNASYLKRQGVGRPRKAYTITVSGRDVLSAKYAVFFELLAKALVDEEGQKKAKEIFASAAKELAVEYTERMSSSSKLELLGELGFQPEQRAGQMLASLNCPILRVAQRFPELTCDTFHTLFLKELLNARDVKLKQAISRGAKECVHEVSPKISGTL